MGSWADCEIGCDKNRDTHFVRIQSGARRIFPLDLLFYRTQWPSVPNVFCRCTGEDDCKAAPFYTHFEFICRQMNKSVLLRSVLPVYSSLSCSTLCLKSNSGIYPLGDVLLQSIWRTGRRKWNKKNEKKLHHTLRGNRQKWGAACDWYCVHFKYWCQRFSLSLHVSLLCSRWRLSPPQNGCQPCAMSGVMTGEEAFPDGWGRVIKPEAVETNTLRCGCDIGCLLAKKKQFKRVKVPVLCASMGSTCMRSWAN